MFCKYPCPGNFVVTLETKPARHGGDHRYVRVYLNWEQNSTNQPMRARIAGRVTPSSQSGVANLEMVEIPLRKPAEFIACCQSTGNIAVACGISVTVFRFCEKTHDLSKVKFIDFEEYMELDMSFIVKEVAVCEDIIGCLSESEAHVFQITINSQLLKANSEDKDTKQQEKRSKSRSKSKTRSASRSPGRSIDSLSSICLMRDRHSLKKEVSYLFCLIYGYFSHVDNHLFHDLVNTEFRNINVMFSSGFTCGYKRC